jgi:integrase
MPRRLRTKIENRTDRLRLEPRRAPHSLTRIVKGARLGYRRVKEGNGTWVLECADGKGGERQQRIGVADDYEAADGVHVLNFDQAAEEARKLVRDTPTSAPSTWARALDDYEADLKTRGGNTANATHVRGHLTCSALALLAKPVALLTAAELKRWRNALVKEVEDNKDKEVATGLRKKSSVVRLLKSARASLNFAANHDPRIANRNAWRVGLGEVPDDYEPVDQVQPDRIVLRIVAEAYVLDAAFGLFVQVAAETGARASQIARLVVADLHGGAEPKLSMPSSKKGKRRTITRRPVPISPDLARRLQRVAKGRAPDAPLLLRDGEAWDLNKNHKRLLQDPFAIVAERVGVDETMYSLRHSSIVRALLAGVPAQLVASNHDTSLQMLQKTYARFISHYGDDIARRALLATSSPVTAE